MTYESIAGTVIRVSVSKLTPERWLDYMLHYPYLISYGGKSTLTSYLSCWRMKETQW